MKPRWNLHLLGVVFATFVIFLLFLREPGFGDDFTYWSFAFDLHEHGLKEWSKGSFHDLRWPVWGVSWLLQAILGPGLLSYYGVPLIYLTAGSLLAFTIGRIVTQSPGASWAAALAFVLHPLLDTVCYRPMPDLSEGVLGAAAVLTWWRLAQARSRSSSFGWAFLLGTIIYVIESNRITGVFIVPVLVLATLLYARRAFLWLVVAGAIALAWYVAEAAFYHDLFGDWLHNLHANQGAKGRKGTESVAFWHLPFRFVDTLWSGNPLAPVYCILALVGGWQAWTRRDSASSDASASLTYPAPPLGRICVIWFITVFLEYSCAPQQLWPWRPLIRDADRFLCGTAVPFSVLSALGFASLGQLAFLRRYQWARSATDRPAALGMVVVAAMALISSRSFFNCGSIPQVRTYIANRPAGTKVFTHNLMRAYAFLIHPAAASKLQWLHKSQILHQKQELEELAAQAQEFWYIRKLVWLNTRKDLETKSISSQAKLASYFADPEKEWTMAQLLAKGDTPDLIFFQRRTPSTPPPREFLAQDAIFKTLIPAMPLTWTGKTKEQTVAVDWPVPADLQGQLCRITAELTSDKVQAFTARLDFYQGKKLLTDYLLKPYTHPEAGNEFFAFQIPPGADRCNVELKLLKGTTKLEVNSFRMITEAPKP